MGAGEGRGLGGSGCARTALAPRHRMRHGALRLHPECQHCHRGEPQKHPPKPILDSFIMLGRLCSSRILKPQMLYPRRGDGCGLCVPNPKPHHPGALLASIPGAVQGSRGAKPQPHPCHGLGGDLAASPASGRKNRERGSRAGRGSHENWERMRGSGRGGDRARGGWAAGGRHFSSPASWLLWCELL